MVHRIQCEGQTWQSWQRQFRVKAYTRQVKSTTPWSIQVSNSATSYEIWVTFGVVAAVKDCSNIRQTPVNKKEEMKQENIVQGKN